MVFVSAAELPKTMRAAQASDYGDIDKVLSVEDGVKVPRLTDRGEGRKQKDWMLIKTHAVAVAPGDCRVLSGKTRELQGPPSSSFPYVPCGDCAGVVVELPEVSDGLPFKVGDRIAARFVEGPRGALGEYSLVSTKVADKVPDEITFDEAAALVGASPATVLADRIQAGEKVLVLGARGGVGSHLCQLLRNRGASYVVGSSNSPKSLLSEPILCNEAVDYTQEDVFSLDRFKKDPFDVIVDLAGHGYSKLENNVAKMGRANPSIVKPASAGGRFLTLVPPAGPIFEIHSIWQMLQVFMFPLLWRAFTSRTWHRRQLPKYTFAMSLPMTRDCVTRTFQLAKKGELKAVIDPKGPFSFITKGVREAFRLQESRHVHGKTVIHVADEK